ncbi:tRNA lysidine(34) synthetase TilS [Geobacter sp. SVR]|uniref:tRNA lysidine(34) synthetase TilS n=1 Tax=Geobacter sp. SVR TaxID=2495594 RepID=UPI00143EFE5A|nr:tRNA lysidine(34) synthetase TilS [Geobacter sp. SVR]BCS54504.1 tRNA(Ile)-lysidine synthase [Geobacter sp. SVR]GCF87104.1 tRNA(Ile)-lysidine synthase [Geobacter sp. SVR]
MTIPPLIARVGRTIREQALFRSGDTVIVGLSGGADSCLLLDILVKLYDPSPRLVVAHLNHCLRGSESDADQEFARALAARHGLPFETRCMDVAAVARQKRLSLEDAGRQARIEFFAELREKWQATAVALAHHADDQAETVLMRLLRGSGTRGLSGMPFRNGHGFIRPLLEITRSEIVAHLEHCGLTWREDASNADMDFLRNRIRHELLPLLESYNPAVRERLAATAGLLADDDHLLDTLTEEEYARLSQKDAAAVAFDVARLASLHPAMQRRLVRRALAEVAGDLRHLSLRHIHDAAALLQDGPPNRSITLPGLLVARREYGRLVFQRVDAGEKPPEEIVIPGPGRYQLWLGMTLEISSAELSGGPLKTAPDTACFDPGKAPFPWLVRPFRPGDRMVPFGMSGSRKVKEIFIDAKLPPAVRRRLPLLFSGRTLIWICGMRASNLTRIDNDSAGALKAVFAGN